MTSFAEATAVAQESSHTYRSNFPNDWCIGSVPHGGFITSCFLRVAKTHFATTLAKQNQPNTITIHLEFLRRTETGPALFTVKDVKLGRQTSVIHVTLTQNVDNNLRQEVLAYITNSNIANESGPSYDTQWSLVPPPPPADISLFDNGDGGRNWDERLRTPFASFRKASTKLRWFFPRGGQTIRSAADYWVAFQTVPGEKFTDEAIGYLSDMMPQIIEGHRDEEEALERGIDKVDSESLGHEPEQKRKPYWYPTLLLNIDIKKTLPEEGTKWLFARTRGKQIKNGRYDLEVIILDAAGEIVALSHHVVFIMGGERNMAKRRRNDSGSKM